MLHKIHTPDVEPTENIQLPDKVGNLELLTPQ